MSPLTLSSDLSPADWIVESLTTFAESVESFVPSGFEAYVRIFHPAARLRGAIPGRSSHIAVLM